VNRHFQSGHKFKQAALLEKAYKPLHVVREILSLPGAEL